MKTCEATHGTSVENAAPCGRRAVLLRHHHDGQRAFLCDRCEARDEMRTGGYTDHSVDPPHYHRLPPMGPERLAALDEIIAATPEPHLAMWSCEWLRSMSLALHAAWEDADRERINAHHRGEEIQRLRHEIAVLRRELYGTTSDYARLDVKVPAPCDCHLRTDFLGKAAPLPPSHGSRNLVICEACRGVRLPNTTPDTPASSSNG